jgi:hypothetical protein
MGTRYEIKKAGPFRTSRSFNDALSFLVKGDHRGSPFDIKVGGQGLGVKEHLDWNHMPHDEFYDPVIGIRNRTHLLATYSLI